MILVLSFAAFFCFYFAAAGLIAEHPIGLQKISPVETKGGCENRERVRDRKQDTQRHIFKRL